MSKEVPGGRTGTNGTDTDELRWLADRLRSIDEGAAEAVVRRWLARVGVDIFDSAADEIDRLRERVAELEAAIRTVLSDHEPIWNGYYSWCQICSPADSSWPCGVRLELDAVVLPPEEERG